MSIAAYNFTDLLSSRPEARSSQPSGQSPYDIQNATEASSRRSARHAFPPGLCWGVEIRGLPKPLTRCPSVRPFARRMFGRVVALLVLTLAFAVTPLSPAAPRAGGTFRVAEPATYIDSIDGALAGSAGDVPLLAVCASLMRPSVKPFPSGFRGGPERSARSPQIS